jgi:hypothetical protein
LNAAPPPVFLNIHPLIDMRILLAAVVLTASCQPLAAQTADLRAEETAIHAARDSRPIPRTSDRIFWSGAYPMPIVGERFWDGSEVRSNPSSRVDQRRNTTETSEVLRLEISASGDMAYEFANGVISYEIADPDEKVSFSTSFLRVWKKEDGQWKEAAIFARPHDPVVGVQ